jgi:hypothetical protein
MFHFPALPPNWLYIHQQVTRHHSRRVSPFGHPRIHARLTAPRGITQPPTSFIGSQCQGIHHAPLNTYNTKNQKKVSPQEKLFELKNSEIAHQHTRQHPPPPKRAGATPRARCSQPLSTNQTPHPTTNVERQPSPIPGFPQRDKEIAGLLPQSPIVCLAILTGIRRIETRSGKTFVVAPSGHPLQAPALGIPTVSIPQTRARGKKWCSLERR